MAQNEYYIVSFNLWSESGYDIEVKYGKPSGDDNDQKEYRKPNGDDASLYGLPIPAGKTVRIAQEIKRIKTLVMH